MNLSSFYYILVHLVLLVRLNVVLSHRNLTSRDPKPTLATANENNSNNTLGGDKTVPINEYRDHRYESSDDRDIPPKKPPKRRPTTSNHDTHNRFNHFDQNERRHTSHSRNLSHPAEARVKPRQTGKNLIVLDLDKRHDVEGYQVSFERNKVIFRAEPSYLFRQVKKGNEIGWYAKNDGQYPYKVVYSQVRGEDEIKVFFPKPDDIDDDDNVEVVKAHRPAYDKSKDPKYRHTHARHDTSPPIPHEHTQHDVNIHHPRYSQIHMGPEHSHFPTATEYSQPEVNIHQPGYTQIPMGSEFTQPEVNIQQPGYTQIPMGSDFTQPPIQPVYNPVQMPAPFTHVHVTPDLTPTHLDPEITHIPMPPEHIHSKVPGGTRSFEPTEAHGSHTHGTDPRFIRRHAHRSDHNLDHQMTPDLTPTHLDPEITHIPMPPEHIHSKVPGGTRSFEPTEAHGSHTHGTDPRFIRRHAHRSDHNLDHQMTPDLTPTHLDPEITHIPMPPEHIHSKVPGGTRSFEPTEAHGSHTHGTDPRFNRRHVYRPDQNVEQEVQSKIADPIARLRERHRLVDETERLCDLSVIDSRPGTTRLPTSPYPDASMPPTTPMTQPDLSAAATHFLPTPASLTPSQPVHKPEPAPTPTPAGTIASKSHEPVSPAQVPESDSSSCQLNPKRLRKTVGESEGILYMRLQVPPQPGVIPVEPTPLQPDSPLFLPEGHLIEDVVLDSGSYPAPRDTSVFDSSFSQSKVMVDASTSTINYADASTQFPERSVPVQVTRVATSEMSTSTDDLKSYQHPYTEPVARSRRSRDPTRSEEVLIESTPADEPIRKPPVTEMPGRQEPITRVIPKDDEVAVEHIFEEADVDYSRVFEVGADEEPESPPSRPPKTRVQTIRQHTASEEPRSKTVMQEVVREHTSRDSPVKDDIFTAPRSSESSDGEVIFTAPLPRDSPEVDIFSVPPPSESPEVDDIFAPPRSRDSTERVSGPRESPEREERVREPRTSESSPTQAPQSRHSRSETSPRESTSTDPHDDNQPESSSKSEPRPSTSGEGIRRTTTSAGDRINITQSENEIRINTADPENGTYSIGIDPNKHDKVVLTFANNSTVFVLDGASHTLGLNQGGEPRDIITERLTMQRAQPQPHPVGGLIGGPTPVYYDVPPVTKYASPQQRDPEAVPTDFGFPVSPPSDQPVPGAVPSGFTVPGPAPSDQPVPVSAPSDQPAPGAVPSQPVVPGADPSDQRRAKFTIPDEALGHLAPPPYSGFDAPSHHPDSSQLPTDVAMQRLIRILEASVMANLANMASQSSYRPRSSRRNNDSQDSSNDSDGEEIASGSPEPSTSTAADPSSTPAGEGESPDDHSEAISLDSAQPRARADAHGSGSGSPIIIPLEEDEDDESGTEFTLDLNATENDANISESMTDESSKESTYKFKSSTRCTEVRIDSFTIWRSGEQSIKKPKDVKVNEAKDQVTISNGTKGAVYKLENGSWKYSRTVTYQHQVNQTQSDSDVKDSPSKKPVQLNIKKKDSTDEFKYVKKDKTGTYTANEGYGFNRVVAKGQSCCSSEKNIWDAKAKNEYGNKVVVDGLGDKKKTLTIHFDEDKKLTFTKETKEWLEQSGALNEVAPLQVSVPQVSVGGG